MKKCYISISMVKKAPMGTRYCKIPIQIANGNVLDLGFHNVMYFQAALRNLLSCSQVAADQSGLKF